jgi:predicted amidohydrolase YtcJ
MADTLYLGGTIITVDDEAPRAEAVAVKNGQILAVGTAKELAKYRGSKTTVFDLNGQTLLPGFVDSHSHVIMGGLQALSANLLAPPDGDVTDIPSLQETLRTWISSNKGAVEKTRLIVGFGYDESQLAEKRAPTRTDLDSVSDDIPMYIVHQSGHFGVANSAALEAAGITAKSEAPAGGKIRRGTPISWSWAHCCPPSERKGSRPLPVRAANSGPNSVTPRRRKGALRQA